MSISTSPRATPRPGIALPIALGAIVVVGALIAGVFFAATQEYRVGRNSISSQRAAQAAEVGLNSVISSWTSARTTDTKVGRSGALADTTIDGVTVKRRYSRVAPTFFWVTVTASQGGGTLESRSFKQLNAVMRVQTPEFPIMGAITSRGKTNVAGAAKISGTDTVPPGMDCPPGAGPVAGVVVNDSLLNFTGSGSNYSISGTPQVKDSTALVADTASYTNFGGYSYDSLAALANKVRTGGGTLSQIGPKYKVDGSCDLAHLDNWGDLSLADVNTACDSYFPIVHLKGATTGWLLNGGPGGAGGQGILLVDGHLEMAGKFTWTGLVIVRGRIRITGNATDGPKVTGAIASMNRNADSTNYIAGGSQTTFSSCAVNQVTSRLATIRPMKHRAWADLSF